ncbi:unnamed protein product [Lactuca saligna]|uniref:Ubiquitin-like protease family profile domain-containing protein n=1 Tax=Lactuca saligna TaxID=75948 RepID=A0AA35ZA18_LACSI|nr:unnamed protein product [Lactuca saligna]
MQLDFGETEYIVISGLRVGPCVDLLHEEGGRSNSNLQVWLFPDITDARLWLKDLKTTLFLRIIWHFRMKMRFAWDTYLWTYTSGLMREMFEKIENFRIFKQANPESKKVHKYTVAGFMLPFKNHHVVVVANETKIMELFYICYVNWTLNHEESPPRQQIPLPIVASAPRRKKCKSKTSSSETATHASTLQQPQVERSYMSSDTSTRNVENGVGGYPIWKDVDKVLFVINVVGVHWFLAMLHLKIWKVNIYDSTRSMNFFTKYKIGGEFQSFGDSIISKLDVIKYRNDFSDGHRDTAIVEFVEAIDAPQQEYNEDRDDCGVFVTWTDKSIPRTANLVTSEDCQFNYANKLHLSVFNLSRRFVRLRSSNAHTFNVVSITDIWDEQQRS